MPAPSLYTFTDIIEHLEAYSGGAGLVRDDFRLRQAALLGYEHLTDTCGWFNARKHGRIFTVAPVTTGTITYTHSTRALEHSATAWSTLASWAAYGRVVVGQLVGAIDSVSGTTATMHNSLNFGQNVAAGTAYTLYRNIYTLPADFLAIDKVQTEDWECLEETTYDHILELERSYYNASSSPEMYAIGPDPDLYGSRALYLWPYPTELESLDIFYRARPRRIVYTGVDSGDYVGTVAVSSATVTGTSTAFKADMVGSVMRLREDSTPPDGLAGTNRYSEQRIVIARGSATAITLDASPSGTYSGSGYRISDPVDIAPQAWGALLRRCEHEFDILLGDEKKAMQSERRWYTAYRKAREDDQTTVDPNYVWSPYHPYAFSSTEEA